MGRLTERATHIPTKASRVTKALAIGGAVGILLCHAPELWAQEQEECADGRIASITVIRHPIFGNDEGRDTASGIARAVYDVADWVHTETKESLIELLGATETADGVSIFIGSESKLFSLSGSSLIVAPFKNGDRKIVGALGVIGPTRLNYARIIPMVDYTARLVGRLLA